MTSTWNSKGGTRPSSIVEFLKMRKLLELLHNMFWAKQSSNARKKGLFICSACGVWKRCIIGHIIPASYGGLFVIKNLRLTCFDCEKSTGCGVLNIHWKMKLFNTWMSEWATAFELSS